MSKKRIAAIVIDSILIILTLAFIFGNSLLNVEKSTDASENVSGIVEKLPPIQSAIEENKITKGEIDGIVRSIAHAIEFSALGAETMLLLLLLGIRPLCLSAFLPFFLCLILGIADESLQMLSDRAAEVVDIIKDFAGSLFGGLAVLGIYGIIRWVKKKKSKQEQQRS